MEFKGSPGLKLENRLCFCFHCSFFFPEEADGPHREGGRETGGAVGDGIGGVEGGGSDVEAAVG